MMEFWSFCNSTNNIVKIELKPIANVSEDEESCNSPV